MGQNGREYVKKNYRWDVILSKYDRMIGKVRGNECIRNDECSMTSDDWQLSAASRRLFVIRQSAIVIAHRYSSS